MQAPAIILSGDHMILDVTDSPETFYRSIQRMSGPLAPFVDRPTIRQLWELVETEETRLFVFSGFSAGFSLSANGYLGHVHNASGTRGIGSTLMSVACSIGARSLECYDGFLPSFYARFGFVEQHRQSFVDAWAPQGWDFDRFGRPDYLSMVRPA